MPEKRDIEPMDLLVGSRIRLRRRIIGVSQQALADHLGLSFQQVQKYEKGYNRVGASRLQAIAEKLEVSPGYFFEKDDEGFVPAIPDVGDGTVAPDGEAPAVAAGKDAAALVKAFSEIADPKLRRDILRMVQGVARYGSVG